MLATVSRWTASLLLLLWLVHIQICVLCFRRFCAALCFVVFSVFEMWDQFLCMLSPPSIHHPFIFHWSRCSYKTHTQELKGEFQLKTHIKLSVTKQRFKLLSSHSCHLLHLPQFTSNGGRGVVSKYWILSSWPATHSRMFSVTTVMCKLNQSPQLLKS